MNALNRILVVLVSAAVIAGALLVCLAALGLIAPGQLGPFQPVLDLFAWNTRPALTAVIAGAILAGVALLVIAELRPTGARGRRLLVSHDELGTVRADVSGIEHLVAREARRVGGVTAVRPTVHERPDGLHIIERLAVAPDANLAEVSRQVQARTKTAVEHLIGRPVAAVQVDARLSEEGRRR